MMKQHVVATLHFNCISARLKGSVRTCLKNGQTLSDAAKLRRNLDRAKGLICFQTRYLETRIDSRG